jgi:hypothetical protein
MMITGVNSTIWTIARPSSAIRQRLRVNAAYAKAFVRRPQMAEAVEKIGAEAVFLCLLAEGAGILLPPQFGPRRIGVLDS